MAYKQSPFPMVDGTSSHRSALKQNIWAKWAVDAAKKGLKKGKAWAEEQMSETQDVEPIDMTKKEGLGPRAEQGEKGMELETDPGQVTADIIEAKKPEDFETILPTKKGEIAEKKGAKKSGGGGGGPSPKSGELPKYSDYLKKAALADARSAWDVVK